MLQKRSYPFDSRFLEVGGHRIHYVEEGVGAPVLFIHGNPTSSYLWRNVIPEVAAAGRRCIAIDLLGFGQSDKPDDVTYTLSLHADIVGNFIRKLDLWNTVLVADDWGGPLGMHNVVAMPERFEAAVLMETFLWTFTLEDDIVPKFRAPFRMMRGPAGYLFVQVMNMMTKKLIPEYCPITDEGMQYYLDSMPTVRSRRAIRGFVRLNAIDGKPQSLVNRSTRLRDRYLHPQAGTGHGYKK